MKFPFTNEEKTSLSYVLEEFIQEEGYITYLMGSSSNKITIDFFDLQKRLNIQGSLKNRFFDSFDNPNVFNFVILAFKNKIYETTKKKNVIVSIKGLESNFLKTKIKDINQNSFDKLLFINCMLRNISQKTMKVSGLRGECHSCGDVSTFLLNSDFIPSYLSRKLCKCGARYKISYIYDSVVRIKVEDVLSDDNTNKTEALYCEMKNELSDYFVNSNIYCGQKVNIIGEIISDPTAKPNEALRKMFFRIYDIQKDTSENDDVNLSGEDIKKILSEVKKEEFEKNLVESFAPKINGYKDVKTSMIIQQLSGINENIPVWDNPNVRKGLCHMVFIGSPGTAKTYLSKFLLQVSPKAYFTSANNSTTTGLLGAVIKDSVMGGDWVVSSGAFSLANKGIIIIDELNNFNADTIAKLNSVISDYVIPIDKASVNTTLYTETKLLGILNPKQSDWEKSKNQHSKQQKLNYLSMQSAFITRMSLIFSFYEDDLSDPDEIERVLKMRHQDFKVSKLYDKSFLKKYFVYAKKKKVVFDKKKLVERQKRFYEQVFKPNVKKYITDVEKDKYENPLFPSKMRVFQTYETLLSGLARLNINESKECTPKDHHYDLVDYLIDKYYLSFFYLYNENDLKSLGITRSLTKSSKNENLKMIKGYLRKKSLDNISAEVTESEMIAFSNKNLINIDDLFDFIDKLNNEGTLIKRGRNTYLINS